MVKLLAMKKKKRRAAQNGVLKLFGKFSESIKSTIQDCLDESKTLL